jgi:hypothetical protein
MAVKGGGGGVPLQYVGERRRGDGEGGAARTAALVFRVLESHRERQRMLRIAHATPPRLRPPLPRDGTRATGPGHHGAGGLEAARVLNVFKLT